MGKILDISHHQPPSSINYDKAAKELDFVIIRTQYGSATVDRHYKTHHTEFKKRGVPTHAYAWVRGVSISDMQVEATDFYNRTKEFNPEVWWLDVEEKSMADMRAGVSAYIKKLRQLGAKKVGVYIANHLYKTFNLNLAEADAVWIPHYGSNNGQVSSKPSFPCDLHQYTDKGKIAGYAGSVDLNTLTGSKPLEWFTGSAKAAPAPKPKPTPAPVTSGTYKIKAGDTFWEIAKNSKGAFTVDDLIKWNPKVDPSKLQVGQVINIKAPATKPAPKPVTAKYPLPNPTLKSGSKGIGVKQLQTALNAVYFKCGTPDGSYGPKTVDAVKRFQSVHCNPADGIYGPKTKAALEKKLKADGLK